MHFTGPEEEDLSHAAWAAAMNCAGICQTAESLTLVGPSFCGGSVDCAAANTLTNATLSMSNRRAPRISLQTICVGFRFDLRPLIVCSRVRDFVRNGSVI